jgi:2-polyprenyl-6-methoxyphenol hydroxylase-like FAD-dependent oxidoreductase
MKIAINGAGVAGPALAYWLLRTGHEPTLIEQAPQFRAGGYLIDFWGVGYTLAERMGLLPQVLQAGYSVQEVRFVDAQGRRAGGFGTAAMRSMVDGRFTSLPRGDLAAQIYRSIEERVETLFDDSIIALDERVDGVRVDFAKGNQRDFDLVIGADGLHSTVRNIAFGPQSQFERRLGYFVAAFEADGYRPRDDLAYVSYAIPGRQISRFALRGDRTMFLFVFRAEHLKGPEPRSLEERKRALHRLFDGTGWECARILAAMERIGEIYFDRVSQIVMPAWSKGRVALIGDAAACVSLLAGEGTGLAMTEAYVLAGELKRAAGDYASGFHRYEQRLRPFVEGKQQSARDFAASFAPKTAFGIWFRNQATKLMGIPAVANRIIGTSLRDDIDLPDYATSTAEETAVPES